MVLQNLSKSSDCRHLIVQQGGIPPLIALLWSFNEHVQEHSAGIVANLSVNPDNARKIVEEGGMPLLIGLLRSPCQGVQEQAAVAIRNLSVEPENEVCFPRAAPRRSCFECRQVRIMEEGGIPPLLALLRYNNEAFQRQGTVTLRNLSVHEENKIKIVQEGGIVLLIGLLRSPDKLIQQHSAGILRNLRWAQRLHDACSCPYCPPPPSVFTLKTASELCKRKDCCRSSRSYGPPTLPSKRKRCSRCETSAVSPAVELILFVRAVSTRSSPRCGVPRPAFKNKPPPPFAIYRQTMPSK
jgi:hypothetical protein